MNDDEKQDKKQEEGLLGKLKKGSKKDNKSKFSMTLRKVFLSIVLPFLLKAIIPIMIVFVIISAFTIDMDKKGDSRITEHAVGDLINDEEMVSIQEENGQYYFEINKEIEDKYLEKLNKAYYDGYFMSSDPEQSDEDTEEFVYDEENARITKKEMEEWFQTKDYKEYLIKMIRAEIASSYPRLGSYDGQAGSDDSQGNKKNTKGNYVAQGIVKIQRTLKNLDGTTGDTIDLSYLPHDKLKELIASNDHSAINYYSFEEGRIYYATYTETVVTTNGVETSREYILTESPPMSYESVLSTCSMPYNFLFALLQQTQNPEYIMKVIDLLLDDKETDIVLMVQDALNVSVYTEIRYPGKKTEQTTATGTEKSIWNEETKSYDTLYSEWTYGSTSTSYELYNSGRIEIIETTYSNTATAFIQKANTWCLNFEQEATSNDTDTPGTDEIYSYTDAELSALTYNTLISDNSGSMPSPSGGSSFTIIKEYISDETLIYSTRVDNKNFGWTINTKTEKEINYEKFLGLWKNTEGKYSLGAKFDEDGKEVGYYLPDGESIKYPAIDISEYAGQRIDTLLRLLELHENTQFHEQLMRYYWNKYMDEDIYNVDVDELVNLFSTNVFISIGGLGYGGPGYSTLEIEDKDIEYLARTVYAERGDGTKEQQTYVASVVLNRVLSSGFPNTVYGVISQKGQFASFEDRNYKSNGYLNETTQAAVKEVVENGDTTGGAIYFMTPEAAARQKWLANCIFLFNDETGETAPSPNGKGWTSTHNFYTTERAQEELSQFSTSSSFNGEIYQYYQGDWANVRYGSGTVATCGCGITSTAMVISTLLNKQVTPADIVAWCGNRYYVWKDR